MRPFALLAACVLLASATAEAKVVISPDQQLMFQAAQKVMSRDFISALALYDQAIATNGGNAEAYIQRSVVKRELKDPSGSHADAARALKLAENALEKKPGNAQLLHRRGMAKRLLKDFSGARADIEEAIRLEGDSHSGWKDDLRALALEEKMGQ